MAREGFSGRRLQRAPDRLRVGVDAAQLGVRGKGVARYLVEMLPELAAAAGDLQVVALMPRDGVLPPGSDGVLRRDIEARPAIAWEQLRLPRVARTAGLSLVHTLTDRLPAVAAPPSVVYLFEDPRRRIDAARGTGTKQRLADVLTAALFPRTLKNAAAILTSSEATRRDVLERGVDPARVRVVYPGIGKDFRPGSAGELDRIRHDLGLPLGYVLHFSSDDPRDDSDVALEAYAGLRRRIAEAPPLLIPGPVSARLPAQQRLARSLGIGDEVRWLGYQSGNRLAELYRGAAAYLDPSLYEGFGFQVAEALASGTPVVCSNTTSLPEVVGDAGLLVEPRDVPGFVEALARVFQDPGLAGRLAAAGPRRTRRFTWSRTAAETVEIWRGLLP